MSAIFPMPAPNGETRTVLERRPYATPVLKQYGDVHRLTQAGGATANGDGGQMMMVAPGGGMGMGMWMWMG